MTVVLCCFPHWSIETHYGPARMNGPNLLLRHLRDGTAGTPELVYRCFHLRASPLSVTTTGRAKQPEDGPRRRRRRGPNDPHESGVVLLEQLADVGRRDPALRLSGLNDHASTGSGPTRQPDALD